MYCSDHDIQKNTNSREALIYVRCLKQMLFRNWDSCLWKEAAKYLLLFSQFPYGKRKKQAEPIKGDSSCEV